MEYQHRHQHLQKSLYSGRLELRFGMCHRVRVATFHSTQRTAESGQVRTSKQAPGPHGSVALMGRQQTLSAKQEGGGASMHPYRVLEGNDHAKDSSRFNLSCMFWVFSCQ